MMGLFDGLFKKNEIEKPVSEKFYAYTDGGLMPLVQVNDETFAEELLGRSTAIMPKGNVLRSPANGTINVVFDTKHAVIVVTEFGAEVLLHIGIDTVSLNGECFETKVKVGDIVKKGDALVEFDREEIAAKGFDPVVLMIITNSGEYSSVEVSQPGEVSDEDVIMSISK